MNFNDLLNQVDTAVNKVGSSFNNIWAQRQGIRELTAPSRPQTMAGGSNGSGNRFDALADVKPGQFGTLTAVAIIGTGVWFILKATK